MGRRTAYPPHTLCWVTLLTPDPEGAVAFYGGLLGWSPVVGEDGETLFRRDGATVAGLTPISLDDTAAGVAPSWSVFAAVEDADATLRRAATLGATVLLEPSDVAGQGRMGAFSDPHGAMLGVWQAGGFAGAELVNDVGAWVWNDLLTPDPGGSTAFYRELLGWTVAAIPASHGLYRSVSLDGRRVGGITQAPPGAQHASWATFFGVEDLDAALTTVRAAGGHKVIGPITVPGGRFASARDPQGAGFALFEGEFDG